MKKIEIKILLAILFLFCGITFSNESDSTAVLTITGEQDSLLVLLDNKVIGKTPIKNIQIPSGVHELVVHSPQWPSWSQKDFQNSFVALAGNSYEFKLEFQSVVTINSVPFGASVLVNREKIGKTPYQMSVGEFQTVQLEMQGYQTKTVDLNQVNDFFYMVNLVPTEEWLISKAKSEHEKRGILRSNRNMMLASLGFAAAAGIATLHFRDKGNEEYAAYQSTAIPANMEDHYSSTEYYDQLASISYALFELGFVVSGYFFLTSRE
jgi:hypothetical protein